MATLSVTYATSDVDELKQAYTLLITVTAATGITDKIFVFHSDTEGNSDFESIADPVDIFEYPEDVADLENEMPYFRLSSTTILFRSLHDLCVTKKMISADIARLVRDVTDVTTVPVTEEIEYDGATATDYF